MSAPTQPNAGLGNQSPAQHAPRRLTTETKAAFKTTEFIFYVVVSIAVLVAAAVTDNGADGQGFGADQAWLFVSLLTIGYMVSRGLAKSGSRERYDD
jgi:hypothetical protein